MDDRRMWIIVSIILIASFVVSVILIENTHFYSPFYLDDRQCKVFYAECKCVGSLIIMESYPPQYSCDGMDICMDVNKTEC